MRFRLFISALLTAGLWAGMGIQSASALSCMAPDLARSMEDAKASDKLYQIIVGEFTLLSQIEIPRQDPRHSLSGGGNRPDFPNPVLAQMRFDGLGLTRSQYSDQPLTDLRLEVQTTCAAHWCGSLPREGQKFIAFMEIREGQSPVLTIGPCPQYVFWAQQGDGQLDTLRRLF